MAITDTKNLWESYNGKGFFAEAAEYSERANKDVDGNSLTLTIDSEADTVTHIGGKNISAKNAETDINGNAIVENYATKAEVATTYATKSSVDTLTADLETALDTLNDTIETVSHAGMYDLGTKDESDLNNGKLAIGCGNSNTELTLTTVSTLTVLANSGVPNFALLVDNSENSNDVTVTVKDSTDATTFYQSTAAGNKVSAGKICQITCVGKCWTLAEFGTANA